MSERLNFVAPLFVPASRPDRFEKAAASAADAIILDLEDAVAFGDKDAARAALRTDFTDKPVIVRINGAATAWFEEDLEAVGRLSLTAIMVPKAARCGGLDLAAKLHPVIALVETAKGIADVRDIAASGDVARLAFGSVDYSSDIGCDHVREALALARNELVLASRLAGLPSPIDGVTTDVSNMELIADDARHARALGFSGKLAIHPRQIEAIFDGFRPSAAEMRWADQVLDSGEGAVAIDGAMVDEPVRARARAIKDRALRFAAQS